MLGELGQHWGHMTCSEDEENVHASEKENVHSSEEENEEENAHSSEGENVYSHLHQRTCRWPSLKIDRDSPSYWLKSSYSRVRHQ